jgi:ubiquinol-cytochrome c reductase cytochrome b subunit
MGGALPSTMGAILIVVAAFAVLYALPWLDRSKPSMPAGFLYKVFVWILALDVIALSITAACPASALSAILTTVFIIWYFLHFLVLTPLSTGAL